MKRLTAFVGIVGFFIPAEVLSAVLLVFTMENVLDTIFSLYIPPDLQPLGWVLVYVIGIFSISALNYFSANTEEKEDLADDIDDL